MLLGKEEICEAGQRLLLIIKAHFVTFVDHMTDISACWRGW